MSSEIFMFDECLYQQHSTIFDSGKTQFLSDSDPLSAPSDSSIDSFLQEFSEELQNSTILEKLDSSSLYQQAQFSNLSDISGGYANYPVSSIKTEDPVLDLDSSHGCFFGSQSYGGMGVNGATKVCQRSYSHGSHSYDDGEKPWFLFQPRFFDALFESSPEMRRVSSTGDLPVMKNNQTNVEWENNATTTNSMQEGNLKVGRYNAEERKERIDRYKAKRTQRNFNKTIKYACRKTLADSRARVRGRFARNDDPGDMPKSSPSSSRYDNNNILFSSWYEDYDSGIVSTGGGNAGGCCGGGRGQVINYQFGVPSELHHYSGRKWLSRSSLINQQKWLQFKFAQKLNCCN